MLDIAIIAENQSKQYFKDVENNSSMNSNNGDQHQRRLNKFVELKHFGTYFYLAPNGGFITNLKKQRFITH